MLTDSDKHNADCCRSLLFAGAAVAGAVGQFLYKSGAEVAKTDGTWAAT